MHCTFILLISDIMSQPQKKLKLSFILYILWLILACIGIIQLMTELFNENYLDILFKIILYILVIVVVVVVAILKNTLSVSTSSMILIVFGLVLFFVAERSIEGIILIVISIIKALKF
jgi:hypothetical protein